MVLALETREGTNETTEIVRYPVTPQNQKTNWRRLPGNPHHAEL